MTNVLAGPFCCHQLVHLGAEVIKVEVPERGDLARQLGADLELNERLMGTSFLAQNAGKRSLTLNLKHEEGRVLFRKLVGTADVVVENFRPGVMDRLGLGFEMLKQVNPQLVYCAISGYGQSQAALLEAALVASVDHGPQAPAIAAARMAVTCGVSLNNAMGTAVNMLGDVHGGAGEQCLEFLQQIRECTEGGTSLENAVGEAIKAYQRTQGKHLPGFGHRFHKPVDPRTLRLMELLEEAEQNDIVSGDYRRIGMVVQKQLNKGRTTGIAMNIDGATAIIFGELQFAPPLARGLFCLSRSVGILAHAWEQQQQGGRNKGPIPPEFGWHYTGPNPLSS